MPPAGYPADQAVVGGFVTVRDDAAGETVTPFDVSASLFCKRPAHAKTKANGLEWVVYGDQRVGLEKLPAAEKK